MVTSNEYGVTRRVEANFCMPDAMSSTDIRFNIDLAGGGAMDMGAYVMNGIRWLLNSEPTKVIAAKAIQFPSKPGIDKTLEVRFEFPPLDDQKEPRVGQASIGWNWRFRSWMPYLLAETDSHILTYRNFLAPGVWHSLQVTEKQSGRPIQVRKEYGEPGFWTYTYQLQAFVNKIKHTTVDPVPWVTLDDMAGNMRAIDLAYNGAGMQARK